MSTNKRSKILGLTQLKNKVNRNAFDLSHRHMFTAQIGELLPIFVQWVNPNETFKIGYNGFTRTQPLQTAAFTRLRENVQYYFVSFQSLWKYFEQQVNNMTTGQSGENISRIAASATSPQSITTGMPYLNYAWFLTALNASLDAWTRLLMSASWLNDGNTHTVQEIYERLTKLQITYYHQTGVLSDQYPVDQFGRLRYCRSLKLLRSLGYLNTDLDSYDLISNAVSYAAFKNFAGLSTPDFQQNSNYGWTANFNALSLDNAPNLSIFPLLAYHKIVNDHYRYRQWQQYDPTTCNIDYLLPSDSMNFSVRLGNTPFTHPIFDLETSNLPLDYFNGVLPKAQYGDESSATIDFDNQTLYATFSGSSGSANWTNAATQATKPDGTTLGTTASLSVNGITVQAGSGNSARLTTPHTHSLNNLVGFIETNDGSQNDLKGLLKISSLRNALALQKYKEIQESNDSDFASQVLAHFGIKPKHDDFESRFIGGCDSTIDINPQVNQNLSGENQAEIKAIGSGTLSGGCKFTSDTYGIIIGIYRCVPQLDFARCQIDRNLLKTDASDFPIPELDSIGMQTQYRFEVCAPKVGTLTKNYAQGLFMEDMSETYGYLPRYAELKTSYDRYEGAFLDSLSSWVTGYSPTLLQRWTSPYWLDSSSSVIPDHARYDAADLLVCDPHITDSIFVNQICGSTNDDRLLIGSVNTCVAVRPFSVYGLPYSH